MIFSIKSQQLQRFIAEHFEKMTMDGGSGGGGINFPDFELTPFDYLEYAEAEMVDIKTSNAKKINCVAHLKRAVECEMDSFLHAMGLGKAIKPDNFPTKMEWLNGMGVISPRSLQKLNTIRNKMEHEYAVPKVGDIELYFELVNAFVHALEGYLVLANHNLEIFWKASDGVKPETSFSVEYELDKPVIAFRLEHDNQSETLDFDTSNKDDFLFAFRVYLLLCRAASGLINDAFVVDGVSSTRAS